MSNIRDTERPFYRVLTVRTIVWASAIMAASGAGTLWWLLAAYGGGGEGDRTSLEAIKTAGTIVVGTGGVAALLLAARRQRMTEIGLRQKDIDQEQVAENFELQKRIASDNHTNQERVAAATELDAQERRITDLYTKAAELLGSDKAAVRLSGLYALERLAKNTENLRQTVVNVLCAYLRMPEGVATESQEGNIDQTAIDSPSPGGHENGIKGAAERQVRQTAQKILQVHLAIRNEDGSPNESFWPDMVIDLSNTVIDFAKFSHCQVSSANFTNSAFHHNAYFDYFRAETASFVGARFHNAVTFASTKIDFAVLHEMHVAGSADFEAAIFATADFTGAAFGGPTSFDSTLIEEADFGHSQFNKVDFALAELGEVHFECAKFDGDASFLRAVT